MEDPGEIRVECGELCGVEKRVCAVEEDPSASIRDGTDKGWKRLDSVSTHHNPSIPNDSKDHGGESKGDGNGKPSVQLADGRGEGVELSQEDLRTRFYEHYRKEAEEYDREFMKKHDEDSNTTLIFAGLFSAVTSAFIIQVHSQLQPDPNEETNALLRVLIHKIDNTTFGGDTPTIPQWTGPPRTIIYVQAMLYASLAASLFSAFLAMLGKQWLNRYASTGLRGTAIERSQDRQRKLDGIVTWYFNHVMESLPLMLQLALLLLGCALSLYLWEINVTVACVILGVTALGATFYAFIVIAGTASVSCPYQTPGARILRHILHHTLPRILYHFLPGILRLLYSAFRDLIKSSLSIRLIPGLQYLMRQNWWQRIYVLLRYILLFPLLLSCDTYRSFRGVVRVFVALTHVVRSWIRNTRSARTRELDQRMAVLDLRCISWILQTSLERGIHLPTLKFLTTMTTLINYHPTLISNCFDILIGCIKVNNCGLVIVQGFEQLAEVSIMCFFRAYYHLSTMDPTPGVLAEVRQHYTKIFPSDLNFSGLPFSYTLGAVHMAFYAGHEESIKWKDCKPSNNEHVAVARTLSKISRYEYQKGQCNTVPRWILQFALHFLSQDPAPPTSVITDCLLIIATDLGCDIPDTTALEDSMGPEGVSCLINQKLNTMAEVQDYYPLRPKFDAAAALFLYAIRQERCGERDIFDAILRFSNQSARVFQSFTPFQYLEPSEMFAHASPQAAVLASRHITWYQFANSEDLVPKWVEAVAVVPYTEEVGRNVVDTLLQIVDKYSPQSCVPIDVWLWLNRRPHLPPFCRGRLLGTNRRVVQAVRALNDIRILVSYLTIVWSEWDPLHDEGFDEMCISIRADLGGIGMGFHRADLVQRLDYILRELDPGSGQLASRDDLSRARVICHLQVMKDQYGRLKAILEEADLEATKTLNQSHFIFMCALPPPYP